MNKGKLYGVGVGPGDPELMTIKALNNIKSADLILLPAADKESCRAYRIAEGVIPEISEKECRFYPFPMSMKKELLAEFHRETGRDICSMLEEGKKAAFLTIGDPTIYSTFDYIREVVEEAGYETEIISGVPSFAACAGRLGISLARSTQEIHIVPGRGDIEEALKLDGTKVFMKSGKKLRELKEHLLTLEMDPAQDIHVYSVSDCGYADERIGYSASDIPDDAGYLTVVIVN